MARWSKSSNSKASILVESYLWSDGASGIPATRFIVASTTSFTVMTVDSPGTAVHSDMVTRGLISFHPVGPPSLS